MRPFLSVLVAALALASPAQAVVIDGPAKYQRWADRSHVPTPRGVVEVTTDPCAMPPRWRWPEPPPGCSYPGRISGSSLTRDVFLYELGHQFEFETVKDGLSNEGSPLRAGYERIRGFRGRPWLGAGIGDFRSPAELFATDYEFCAKYARTPWVTRYGDRAIRRTCALIRRAR